MKNNNNKSENNSLNNIFLILAIVLVAVALLNFGITYFKISEFKKSLTGFVVGYINLTINTNIIIDISPVWGINWSNGSINPGEPSANLTTAQNGSFRTGGNWSIAGVQGIMIINSGNVNASLTINGTKNNTDWFGVTGIVSNYTWNVTNALAAGSCHGGNPLNKWVMVNHTAIKYCAHFGYLSTNNKIWLDVNIQVPSDTTYVNVPLSDRLTILGATAG